MNMIIIVAIIFIAIVTSLFARKIIHTRFIYTILLSYLVILIVLTAALYVVPMNGREPDPEAFTRAERASNAIYHAFSEGKLTGLDDVTVKKNWKLSHDGDVLHITSKNHSGDYWILLERSPQLDGAIEVSYYNSPAVFRQIDYTDLVAPPEVTLENGSLTLSNRSQQKDIRFMEFQRDAYIEVFVNPDKENNRSNSFSMIHNSGLWHIVVPERTRVSANLEFNLNWMNTP